MIILGIETSCDETAASLVEDGAKIIANIVASSSEMHTKTGGIIPEVAAREQVKSMIPVVSECLSAGKIDISQIDAIGVTIGPGLIGSLLVGTETAKTLSYAWSKPITPVNHLVGHIYANWLDQELPKLPAIALVVSGGHTDLVLMKDHEEIEWIGGTRDDAAGECLDKCARLLDLGYPGGPVIANEAQKFNPTKSELKIKLPRPMLDEDNFDFSFSGLKTAVLREVNNLKINRQGLAVEQLSYEIQEAVTDVLVAKTLRAVQNFQIESVILAGGVSANQRLREKMKIGTEKNKVSLHIPPLKLCTDNAAYIASCAFFNYHPLSWQEISPNPSLTIISRV